MESEELATYLAEPCLGPQADVLAYWKKAQNKFPILATMAQSYLALQVTSVPSERLFSSAGLTITDRRTRLDPSRAEQIIFLAKNLKLFKP
jgi:hypothetical protein